MYISRDASAADGVQGMNYNKGIVEPIVSEMLVDGIEVDGTTYNAAGYWFLLGDFAGIKGIVYQMRMAPELQTQKWSPDSEYTFNTDNFQIGARMRGEAFLALPHLIHANLAT
jgi:phage major head subunit gpT-like protein